jgi:7-cyano-7-deazaguanine synthase in queuosine biosynthesis
MVSLRCKMLVKDELIKLGLHYISVDLGMVEIMEEMNAEQHQLLKLNLLKSGLELLDDKKSILKSELKRMKAQVHSARNGIYISTGAVLLIILIIILL